MKEGQVRTLIQKVDSMNRHSLALFGVVVAWTLTGVGKAGEPGRLGEPRLRSAATATESASPAAHKGSPAGLPPLRLIAKPADHIVPRRAHVQPAVPAGAKEIPYVETAPEPALTDAERQRGYLLFSRPTVEPVYPNTRPRPDERLEALVAFATPGQFEPLTLALYPVRPLVNLKVRVSALVSSAGEIPADCIDVRLGTYWNVGYPSYTTVEHLPSHAGTPGARDRPLLALPASASDTGSRSMFPTTPSRASTGER